MTSNLSLYGRPLNRLILPEVRTLISQPAGPVPQLAEVNVARVLSVTRPQEVTRPVPVSSTDTVGIQLTLNLLDTTPSGGSINPSQAQAVIDRRIPTNAREARDMLDYIVPQRSGSENRAFGINELKQICKNLNLPTNGNKADLANRIRSYIIELFNLPQQ